MSGYELISSAGVGLIGLGLIATWFRNGKSSSKAYGSMENRVKSVEDKLVNPDTGLGAIKRSVDQQALHCARISTSYGERIKYLEGMKRSE